MRRFGTRLLVAAAILAACGRSDQRPPAPPPPTLATTPGWVDFGALRASGELPAGWSRDPLGRLVSIERVEAADIAVMSVELSELGPAAQVYRLLTERRRQGLEVFAGARPEIVSDITQVRPGLWTMVTRLREPLLASRWSYRVSTVRLGAGANLYRCDAQARFDKGDYWHALVDICTGLRFGPRPE